MKTTTKLAVANLKTNKSRTILISISIMLTTMLLTVIALSGFGAVKEQKVNAGKTYGEHFGGYVRVNDEIYEKMKIHGEFLDVGRMLVSLSLGNVLGYLAWLKCRAGHVVGISTYSVPVAELLVMAGILLGLQVILSGYMSGYLQKDALIERIRHQE